MRWSRTTLFAGISLLAAAAIATLLVLSIVWPNWFEWTGFTSYQSPDVEQGREFERYKTLWNWLQLFFVPAGLALLGLILGTITRRAEQERAAQDREVEREIAADRARAAVLDSYLAAMTDLMLERGLESIGDDDPYDDRSRKQRAQTIARARTLSALSELTEDSHRKRILLLFLNRSRLIDEKNPIVDLADADLTYADLSMADLDEAQLYHVNLSYANLQVAFLNKANLGLSLLVGARLAGARLMEANLSASRLNEANLHLANLTNADLTRADLTKANLRLARLSGADLTEAKGLTKEQLRSARIDETTKHDLGDLESDDEQRGHRRSRWRTLISRYAPTLLGRRRRSKT